MKESITFKEAMRAIGKFLLGVAVIVALISWGMSNQKRRNATYAWKGSVARVTNDQRTVLDSKDFKTLEACREWSQRRMDNLDLDNGLGAFSCGRGCTWKENSITGGKQLKQYVCTEVVTE